MKSIIALVLFIACAAQVHSACVNTNYLYKDYGYPSRCGLYNNHRYDALDWYPEGVFAYGTHYPHARSCSCGSCPSCRGVAPVYSPYALV